MISGGTQSRYQYEAKEYDSVVGDYDFHARKVNPDWGVFTQPDTIIQNVYDPQSLNRYAFERNNPYKYTDPTGITAKATVNSKAKTIKIGAKIYIYGKGASKERTKEIQQSINRAWSANKISIAGGAYKVESNARVIYVNAKPASLGDYENAIEMKGRAGGFFHTSNVVARRGEGAMEGE